MCQFLVDMADGVNPIPERVTLARRTDGAGLSCDIPELNSTDSAAAGGVVAQTVRLRLSEDGQSFFDSGIPFVFYFPPKLTSNRPSGGPTSGSELAVSGSGLHALLHDASAARCKLGSFITSVAEIAVDGRELTCVVPSLPDSLQLGEVYPVAREHAAE